MFVLILQVFVFGIPACSLVIPAFFSSVIPAYLSSRLSSLDGDDGDERESPFF
jgi:hypothetical protein